MIRIFNRGVLYNNGRFLPSDGSGSGKDKTMAYKILNSHGTRSSDGRFHIVFDAMASHDITYVGIIQTARATGRLEKFPIPYVLTNCHNSLCAVGGTINEDDHRFGLSACKKYGGIFVPAHEAVIHSYMRENYAGCGKMIIGSDSHTRYGALGTLGIGEGGPELVKQLLGMTYDIDAPRVVCVHLTGKPAPYVGPHDVALALIGAVFKAGIVKNSVIEFAGDGISNLSVEFRNGVDVMTTETACLSSVWETDKKTEKYLALHGRKSDYKEMKLENGAYYDALIEIDLSAVEPMIALPFHPSNVYTIREFKQNAAEILRNAEIYAKENLGMTGIDLISKVNEGKVTVDQGVIAGCAGGIFDNICAAADIMRGKGVGGFPISVYPASQPEFLQLLKNGVAADLISSGATFRTAFCGPCFGACDTPSDSSLSVRHTTRNFPNREGSKPNGGQSAAVALMDARSIAATAINGGILTSAAELNVDYKEYTYEYNDAPYKKSVFNGWCAPDESAELIYGPGIADWPKIYPLADNILMQAAACISDPVTTTDELIPSGETSSYRSNPYKLSEFTLSRKCPDYVSRAKAVKKIEDERIKGVDPFSGVLSSLSAALGFEPDFESTQIGSVVVSVKPGDGSAREQAASCQRVLGGVANICSEYATKRYRSNLINWGMLPFTCSDPSEISVGDYIFIPGIKDAVRSGETSVTGTVISDRGVRRIVLYLPRLSEKDRNILLSGCLINSCSDAKKN